MLFRSSHARTPGANVGTYPISIGTLSAGDNYDVTFVGADLAITPRAITVTVTPGQAKTYGETDPAAFAWTVSPALVGTDTLTGSLVRDAGEDAGTYPITIGSLAASANYDLAFVPGSFTIDPRPVTVSVTPGQGKTYGETDPAAFAYTATPALVGSDEFAGSLVRTSGENAGTYPISIGSLSAGANYALTFEGASFTIARKTLSITADAQSKTYGTTDPALTYASSGLVAPDALTGALSRVAGEDEIGRAHV